MLFNIRTPPHLLFKMFFCLKSNSSAEGWASSHQFRLYFAHNVAAFVVNTKSYCISKVYIEFLSLETAVDEVINSH